MNIQKLQPFEFDTINKHLEEIYGKMDNGWPYFRLMWSEDILEKRKMTHTDEGYELMYPEVREVPKYRHYIRNRYLLEGLTVINEYAETDLVEKISYEPVWTFETNKGDFLIPRWDAIRIILETIRNNQENAGKVKYVDPDSNPEEALENKKERVDALVKDLFGDESAITTALSHRSGVGYGPGSSPNATHKEKE